MNNQFATQFLLQEDEFSSLEDHMFDLGADEELIRKFMKAIRLGILKPSQALDIIKSTLKVNEDGGAAAAAPAGGSTTGGGVTNGASFTPGTGEQYAAGTRKKRVKEGTFEDDEVAIFDGGDDGLTKIYKKADGSFYGVNDNFDFTAKDEQELLRKTAMWGYKLISGTVYEDAPRLAGNPAKTNSQGAKNISTYTDDGFTKAPSAAEAGKKLKSIDVEELWEEEPLSESRAYSQFKREAATRSKPDQLHQAAKMVHNKLDEIQKLLEFTSQMRSELSEGEENLEYKHNTKKVFERIHSKVVEVYSKVKNLK